MSGFWHGMASDDVLLPQGGWLAASVLLARGRHAAPPVRGLWPIGAGSHR